MGWDNPPVPWREFERRLSWGSGAAKEAPQPQRPEPATSHPVVRLPVAAGAPSWAELHCHSSYSFLDGASSPAELVHEAAERGLTALAITDHDGMYGVPQFAQAAARIRQSGAQPGTVFGAELSIDLPGRRGRASPIRPGGTCSCSPVTRRVTGGCAGSSAPRSSPAARRAGRSTTEAALAGAHDGHWVILTGCRKGAVPAALAAGGPEAAARASWTGWSPSFGARNVQVELTIGNHPADDERNDALAGLAAAAGRRRDRDQQRALRRAAGRPAGTGTGRDQGPAPAWMRWTAGWPPPAAATCAPARRWQPGCAATPACWRGRRSWPRSAPSTSTSSRPGCRTFPVPTATPRRAGCGS